MRALTESEIRASFINVADPARVPMPFALNALLWEHLDYVGWVDARAPEHAYLVTDVTGPVVGITLRVPRARPLRGRHGLCSLCRTQHRGSNTSLMVAPRAGEAGRNHNTVGTYMCADLACSLYVRGLRRSFGGGSMRETIDEARRIERLRANLAGFLARVAEPVPQPR